MNVAALRMAPALAHQHSDFLSSRKEGSEIQVKPLRIAFTLDLPEVCAHCPSASPSSPPSLLPSPPLDYYSLISLCQANGIYFLPRQFLSVLQPTKMLNTIRLHHSRGILKKKPFLMILPSMTPALTLRREEEQQ